RIAEPGQGTEPDRAEVVVQHAQLRMEDHAPHRRADDRHDEERQEQEHADRTEKPERLGEEQCEPQAGQELDQHGARGEERGDDDGARELGIVGEARVVREADVPDVTRPDQPPVVEADPRRIGERDQIDREQKHQARQQEPPSCPAAGHGRVRRYFPRIRFVPASISFSAASSVSSPAVSLPAVTRRFSWMSAYSRSRGRSFVICKLTSSVSAYGSAAFVLGSLSTEKRGLWIAEVALGNVTAACPNSRPESHVANCQAASWLALFLAIPIVHTPRIGVCRTAFGTCAYPSLPATLERCLSSIGLAPDAHWIAIAAWPSWIALLTSAKL